MTTLAALAALLRCPHCRATAWSTTGLGAEGSIRCETCGSVFHCTDGVLDLGDARESTGVALERAAARESERVPELGGINDAFDDLTRAEGPLKDAILALPYGDGSRYYGEAGYFNNVRRSSPAFDFLVRSLEASAGERLLDVGADLTWSTSHMARRGLNCTALDINHHLAVGRMFAGHFDTPYHLVRGDMSSATFRNDAFDIVIAINALHHAARLEEATANIARMLRPGGRLGFIEPYCANEQARAEFGRAQVEAGVSEHTYLLPEWHRAMVNAGLRTRVFRVADSFAAIYEKASGGSPVLFERFYAGSLSLARNPPQAVRPGETLEVPLAIRNTGNAVWCSTSQFPVLASYHLSRHTENTPILVAFDNPRTPLPGELEPGQEMKMLLRIEAPSEPGEYAADIDLVHEFVSWFSPRGLAGPTLDFVVV
jgi:SAM-dependent methyltransferase